MNCSFCKKCQAEVRKLIAGPKVYICDECIELMPGIGPHTEAQTLELVLREMGDLEPSRYAHVETVAVAPSVIRSRDNIVVHLDDTHWLVEVRRLRLPDDDGTPDDQVVRNILSPYPQHHGALTDAKELKNARFEGQKAVLLCDATPTPTACVIHLFEPGEFMPGKFSES